MTTTDFQRKSLDNILLPSDEKSSVTEATERVEKPDQPITETQKPETAEEDLQATDVGGQKMVPLSALQAERGKGKRYTDQVADFDKRMEATNQAWERRFNQMMDRLAPKHQPQQEQPPDFLTDPDAALAHRLAPIQQDVSGYGMNAVRLASEARAMAKHGTETYSKMEKALQAAMDAGDPEVSVLAMQVQRASDPAAVAMAWYERRPEVVRDKLRAEFQAELQQLGWVAPEGAQGVPPPAKTAPVMPSNLAGARNVGTRAGPAWSGPKPLADIFKR